jgi:hypothetical protein
MSLLKNLENDAAAGAEDVVDDTETAIEAVGEYIDDTVWPELKQFLLLFTPLEAKSLLGDILGAIPTAGTSGVPAAAVQVTTEIGAQTIQNAQTAAGQLVDPPAGSATSGTASGS